MIALAGGLSLATAAIAQPPNPSPGYPDAKPSSPAASPASPDDKSSTDPSRAASPSSPRTSSDTAASATAPANDDANAVGGDAKGKKKSKHMPAAQPSDDPAAPKPH
jgi:hypothetical protein